MSEHPDIFDEMAHGDSATRELSAALQAWKSSVGVTAGTPDTRLQAMFDREPASSQPARWRQWLQRPAIAFAASFVAVLIVGAGAFALVARDNDTPSVAATSTSIVAQSNSAPGEITLPQDLSEQTGYASCVFNQLTSWFTDGFAAADAPRLVDECGLPPIPDLGPDAAAFRDELQTWANCVATQVGEQLPDLPMMISDGNHDFDGFLDDCGEPPHPEDYGLTMPSIDWENFDPSIFGFDSFDFGQFDLGNLDELLKNLPEGLLPENFDLEQLRQSFGSFPDGFDFDFESCDPADLPDINDAGDLKTFDFQGFLEGCGMGELFNLDGLDLENLNLGELNLEQLLGQLHGLEGLDLENLEGLDLQQLIERFMGSDLDLSSLFEDFSSRDT